MKKVVAFFMVGLVLFLASCSSDSSDPTSGNLDRIMRAKLKVNDNTTDFISNEFAVKCKLDGGFLTVGCFPNNAPDKDGKYWLLEFKPEVDGNFNILNDTIRLSETPNSFIAFEWPESEEVENDSMYYAGTNDLLAADKELTIVIKAYDNLNLIEAEFTGWIKNTSANPEKWVEVREGYLRTDQFLTQE